jgi:hypothetical protein
MQINIAKGNQTVRIQANDNTGPFNARVYVNTRGGQDGDATLVARSFNTLKGAEKWAAKELAK